MEKLFVIGNKRVILNTQYSKSGFVYPRLFIEVNEDKYINFDLSLNATFKMKRQDFLDWLIEVEVISEKDYEKVLLENNINYVQLKKFVEGLT